MNKTTTELFELLEKWKFKMDFCKVNGYNPADDYFWDVADKVWENLCRRTNNEQTSEIS